LQNIIYLLVILAVKQGIQACNVVSRLLSEFFLVPSKLILVFGSQKGV